MTVDMSNVLCTRSHEYIIQEGDVLKIGITDFAVEQLGDIVFVELPEVGTAFEKGDIFGTIESVKAASELYLPVSGKIVEINEKVQEDPESINNDCFGDGWLVKVVDFKSDDLNDAMYYDEYKDFLEQEEE
ncbi:MAG: glycine cleavage system protein H [Candidatus Melainabacteria bacterium GWF2_37_15]|nr:MAG: glycine cleavage system protein H [Candidatus Melainabacteria bacterium GWF2_37_15]